jgi:ribonuclease HII
MQLLNAGQRLPSTNTWSNCTLSASTARFIANIVACKILMLSISLELDACYPEYGFAKHKGYGTKQHLSALEEFGALKNQHRYSFTPVKNLSRF